MPFLIRFIIIHCVTTIFSGLLYAATLHVQSYNVYFDNHSGIQRYPNIIKQILTTAPDVIALQEVTQEFLALLRASDIGLRYKFSPIKPTGRYFNLTLSKETPILDIKVPFNSSMGRHILITDLFINNKTIRFLNVHLESLETDRSRALRANQIKSLEPYLSKNSVLLGDFNFSLQSLLFNKSLFDLIDAGGNTNHTPTYDIEHNHLAQKTADYDEGSRRIDRIYISKTMPFYDYKVLKTKHSDHYAIDVHINF